MASAFFSSVPAVLSVWSLRPETRPLDVVSLVFVSLVLYAWFVQYDIKEISRIALSLFDFRNWGKPLRLISRNGRDGLSRKVLFFVLSWIGLAWWAFFLFSGADRVGSFRFPLGSDTAFWDRQVPLFLFSLLFVLIFYVLKRLLVYGISYVLEEEKFASVVWKTGIFHDLMFSLLAIPFLSVSALAESGFQTWIFRIVLVAFLISLILKILHLAYEGRSLSRFSHLHIFAYLCALEILLPVCMWQAFFVYNSM